MVVYIEEKEGNLSVFKKIVADQNGTVVAERKVCIPLYRISKDGFEWHILYDDSMKVLSLPTSYLNFDLDGSSNTKRHSATALRLLYVFLSLSNYDVNHIGLKELNELIKFLQGINSNPDMYKTKTIRSNATVNGYLSIYRAFFRRKKIKCIPLFDAKIVKEVYSFENDSSGIVEKLQYKNNLRISDPHSLSVPKYISPSEFESLYKLALKRKDKQAMLIMRLMYCYGLRLGEVLGITTEDIKEAKRDGILVPILILRNRISDKPFQYAKNLGHVEKKEAYRSKDYTKAKVEIIVDYSLFELLIDYVNEAHGYAIDKYPDNYEKGQADIVSWRERPDTNHYVFLNRYGKILSAQTWGNKLKEYFKECEIVIDYEFRENNLSHRFRHGFAMLHAHYSETPVDVLHLKNMMRHRSISSTMVYYNPTMEEEFKIKTDFIEELYKLVPSLKEGEKIFE